MRLLIVSYFFPPYNTIGAVRVGKTAAYLARWGHDVRVLSADDQPLQASLPVEIDESRVTRTPWHNVNAPIEWAAGGRARVAAQGMSSGARPGSLKSLLGRWYKTVVNLPDGQIGWLPHATKAGEQLLEDWRPDLILASAMPPTSLIVAERLARKFNIPWVAEMRDLWVDEGSYQQPWWRRSLEKRWERQLLRSTAGIVTVSEPLAEHLKAEYRKPTTVVLNGYDPSDFEQASAHESVSPRRPHAHQLQIAYTGMIYAGRRDPGPLFQALGQLGSAAQGVRVDFFGRYLQPVIEQARAHGVSDQVQVHDSIGYHESLRVQQQSDLLLLLIDGDPRQRGVYTGKLFEYLGARRPILAIGPRDNVAARLILDRGAGVVLSDPHEIAQQLLRWLHQKETGTIASLSASVLTGLTRAEQVRQLERFLLDRLVESNSQRAAA
jgi:hypothetical protein